MDYSALARSYNTLSYTNQLRDLLGAFFPANKYDGLTKYELAKSVSDIVFKHYDGEQVLKYKLAKEFLNKNNISAFEVKAKSSRTDFLVINGDTRSFEVKSKVDTLNRLSKQVRDYGDVFEFNTVVIDEVHLAGVMEIIPEYYGIWYFKGTKKIVFRAAQYSPNINATEQLSLFNKKELMKSFGKIDKVEILSSSDSARINQALKEMLKQRYVERWNFIKSNWNQILPIDLQFFFNTNVKPEVIYGV